MDTKPVISKYLLQKCCDGNIPFSVAIELTYRCNLACRHCYTDNKKRRELSLSEIKDILDQLAAAGTFYVCFTGGEIFLRPDIDDILLYARSRRFFQVLLSNGTYISRDNIGLLKEIKPQGVEISLLGATPETHDGITGVAGSFERAVAAMQLLVGAGIFVYSKTTLLKANVAEYSRIKALAEKIGAYPKISSMVVPKFDGSQVPRQDRISWADRKRYLRGAVLEESFLTSIENDDQSRLTCKAGKAVACISPYGEVSPCILLPISLGNVRDKPFQEIWHDPDNATLNQLRALQEEDLEHCFHCRLKRLCSRCAGAAYLEHNNLRAPSSAACDDAQWKSYRLSEG